MTYTLSPAALEAAEAVFYGRGGEHPTGQSALAAIVEAAVRLELEAGRLVLPVSTCARWTPGHDRRTVERRTVPDAAPHDGVGTNPEE